MEPKLALDRMADRLIQKKMVDKDMSWEQVRKILEDIYQDESHEYHNDVISVIMLTSELEESSKTIKIAAAELNGLRRELDALKKEERGEYGFGGDWWKQ